MKSKWPSIVLMLALAVSILGALPVKAAPTATKTWVPTTGGAWTTAVNWSPSGVPAAGDDVIINSDQSSAITAIPDISLNSLTISGNVNLQSNASSGNYRTIIVTGNFSVSAGKTVTFGSSNTGRLDFTLASAATGNIAGTVYMNSYSGSGYDRTFTDSGNLTITSAGLITGQNTSIFVLSSGATLQIGSTAGITTSGATGNIQVPGTRTYNAGANYVYNGTANQVTGTGLPTNLTGSLTINNPGNTVTLNNARTIANGGTVNIQAGTFAAGTNLTMASTSTINRSGGSMTGTPQGGGLYNVNYSGDSMTTTTELAGSGLNNVTVSMTASSTTVTSQTSAFTVGNNLTVTQGNLILQATNADYVVTNDLTVSANGTLTHSVYWDGTGKLLKVSGNIAIDGVFAYTVRSHVQMSSPSGSVTRTVRTGANSSSAFSILTLVNGGISSIVNASGTLKVDDNFWAGFNFNVAFHTNGNAVTAGASLLNAGGTVFIDGGSLNVTGGLQIGTSGSNGAVNFSSGTLTADFVNIGDGTRTGTLSQSGGTANIGDLTIYATIGNAYTCTNAPAINISGNWTNNGASTAFAAASSTVAFNGGGAQTIGGTSSTTFYNLTINNGSADADGITLGANETVNNTLTLTDGLLKVASYSLTLGASATISGGASETSMVVTDIDGSATNDGSLCKVFAGNVSFTFPVGDAYGTTERSPSTLSFTANLTNPSTVCVRVTNARHPNRPGYLTKPYLDRYWTVTSSDNAFSCTARFDYKDADIAGGGTESEMKHRAWNGTAWATYNAVTAGSNYFQSTLTSFSDQTAWADSPTAVTLESMEAVQAPGGGRIDVTWQTAQEVDNQGFNLWRGTARDDPGVVKLNAAIIPSQAPGSGMGASYAYADTYQLTAGTTYFYWLEDVALDGTTGRHEPVTVTYSGPTAVGLAGFGATPALPAALPLAGVGLALAAGAAAWARRRRR